MVMILDEAIRRAEKVVEEHEKFKQIHAVTFEECEYAAEQRQLAEWLKDYKRLKEQEPCDDCISRQAVLEYIEGSEAELGHSSENELVCQHIKDLPPVTLEQDPCGDCISRQAVIDMTGLSEWFDSSDSYNEFVIALSELPPVNSQEPKQNWIPCSERLPKPREDVWVNSDIGQIQGYYEEHVGVWYASFGQGRDYLELIVNAWMPLPENYKAESDG